MQEVSPWCPSRYTVTSMFMMSPSCSGLESGIPWHTTSFTDVHTDLGNLPYRNGEGYAPASIIIVCTAMSISSVVTPGCTILPAICSTCAASLHAARIFGSVRSSWTMMLPFHPGLAYVAAYGGRGMCAGTSLSGLTVAAFICGLLSRPRSRFRSSAKPFLPFPNAMILRCCWRACSCRVLGSKGTVRRGRPCPQPATVGASMRASIGVYHTSWSQVPRKSCARVEAAAVPTGGAQGYRQGY
mmetsp:Transcript_7284/g.21459  ORF Transcript_7284/g.21459 Transcript_7284/m.21459 type:complete len:242 (-) Transcript_7284:114-839(-)